LKDETAYILGADQEELFRLGVQHQVWAEETQRGWRLANFSAGQTILDLGCGPGYCTKELAFIAGNKGKVIGIDKSGKFIKFLAGVAKQYNLNIEAIHTDFDEMQLQPSSIDRMYCRWALAWEALAKAIIMALKSFKDTNNEIDIGRHLSTMLPEIGMKVISIRPMAKIATPKNGVWQWPKTFFQSYFPRLVDQNYLTPQEVKKALSELEELEKIEGATICPCLMVEVIAEKI